MIYLLLAIGVAAAAYQLLVLAAALRHKAVEQAPAQQFPGVSILKPVRGLDPHFYESIRSHALIDYPCFEIIFGASDADDPAVADIERLQAEFPEVTIRFVHTHTDTPNRKAGVLADLAKAARYPVLLVNDSDIAVEPDYLSRVVAPLEDDDVGMVTCLYRARADSWAGKLESVGIATDFVPGVLVAPLVGVSEFALGSTMVFRAADLVRIGGFLAVADYVADDYQLSKRIRALGRSVVISTFVVETSVPETGLGDVWRHQLRWSRTIRMTRGGGYAGLPLTNATLWAVALASSGAWRSALGLFGLRMASGLFTAVGVLGDRRTLANAFLIPLRDLGGLALWAGGLFGSTVVWRDARLRLDSEGRITEVDRGASRPELETAGRT